MLAVLSDPHVKKSMFTRKGIHYLFQFNNKNICASILEHLKNAEATRYVAFYQYRQDDSQPCVVVDTLGIRKADTVPISDG